MNDDLIKQIEELYLPNVMDNIAKLDEELGL